MLNFITTTLLPIEAAITIGVSVKENGKIGKFGTGLKYAIAGILRLGGSVSVHVGAETYTFGTLSADIRGKQFALVTCNGERCGFTTEMGKHWQPWMLFRELASNTLDEGGTWSSDPHECTDDETVIEVSCRDVEEVGMKEAVFLPKLKQLIASTSGAQVYDAPSAHYYFNGIRAGDWGEVAPVTVDISSGSLTEDRTLDLATAQRELTWAFRTATAWDEKTVRDVLAAPEQSFWARNIQSYSFGMPNDMADFAVSMRKMVRNPSVMAVFHNAVEERKGKFLEECEPPNAAKHMIQAANKVCANACIDAVARDKLHFTRDLPDGTLGLTKMDTRDVWLSTKAVMLGQNEFTRTYLEECFHAMTGMRDATREMQDALIAIIVAMAEAHHA